MIDSESQKTTELFNEIIRLATQPGAAIETMEPIEMITSAASLAVENQDDADNLLGLLVGTLAWITHHHWPSVSTAIREANGQRMH